MSDGMARARQAMLELVLQYVKDPRVIEVMAAVPREAFVLPEWRDRAYEDSPLPIGHGQTISQPLMVAMMLEAAAPGGAERVLEVGAGSGYTLALLRRLAGRVYGVERIPELAARAVENLRACGISDVTVETAGPALGMPRHAPYDLIVVSAAAPNVPQPLLDQLVPAGRLVMPVGSRMHQELVRVRRSGAGWQSRFLGPCRFVPLIEREPRRSE